ncbi:MAG: hypothetical protein VW397_04535, partial [Candidatus Margulisiibacteriota bacterium]
MTHQLNVKKYIVPFLLGTVLFFLTGCAKTVTQKLTAGSEITFAITFNAPPTFTTHNYYIIFGDNSFNLNTNLSSNYFFIPGESYNISSLDTVTNGSGLINIYNDIY